MKQRRANHGDGAPEELNRLLAKNAELEAALRNTERELRAVRESMSWRVTGPLRLLYGLALRALGSGP